MNIDLTIVAIILLLIGLFLFFISFKQKNNLENNYTIKGILIKYKRSGKYLCPVIKFTDDNEEKIIIRGGIVNFKPIKVGSEIKILKKDNGRYLTESDIKLMQYYAITLIISFILLIFIKFYI